MVVDVEGAKLELSESTFFASALARTLPLAVFPLLDDTFLVITGDTDSSIGASAACEFFVWRGCPADFLIDGGNPILGCAERTAVFPPALADDCERVVRIRQGRETEKEREKKEEKNEYCLTFDLDYIL